MEEVSSTEEVHVHLSKEKFEFFRARSRICLFLFPISVQPGCVSAAVSGWLPYNVQAAMSKATKGTTLASTSALLSVCLSDNTFLHLQPCLLCKAVEPGSQGASLLLQIAPLPLSFHFQHHCDDYHPSLNLLPIKVWKHIHSLEDGERKTL